MKYTLKKGANSSLQKLTKVIAMSLLTLVLGVAPLFGSSGDKVDDASITQQDKKTQKGVVLDQKGFPLIGVSVKVEAAGGAVAITNMDGEFTITAKQGDIIDVSYLGYTSKKITITDFKDLRIDLSEDDVFLGEVVVTALGIKREQKALSYNVQEIKGEELLGVKDANLVNSLAGKIAGVNINASAAGVGGATRVVMRGTKSISKDNNALYVIDGVPIFNSNRGGLDQNTEYENASGGEGISDLNPEDIESMSVLTGPSAAALYGASAANGVILITTKQGKAGKPKVIISNQTTFSRPFVMPFSQNRYGNSPNSFRSWGDLTDKRYDPKDYFDTGAQHQTTASVSMGTETNQVYISLGLTGADGIIPGNEYNKQNVSVRNTTKFLNDKMTVDFGFSYIKQNDKNMIAQGQYYNPLLPVYTYPRNEVFGDVKNYESYDPSLGYNTQNWQWGDQSLTMQNPYWIQNRNPMKNKKDRYMMNLNVKYDILDWLNVAGRVRFDNSENNYSLKKYASTIDKLISSKNGGYKSTKTSDKQTYADLLFNVNKYVGDYSVNANIGTSFSDMRSLENGVDGWLVIPNYFAWSNVDRNDPKLDLIENGWHEQTQSIFANFEIGWKSMVYLTLTGRNDWASPLANSKSSSFFYPSVGLSGVVSEILDLPKSTYLQVRGSYASVGSPMPRNLTIPTYPKEDGKWQFATYMPVSNLKPERTGSWELGLSSKFLNNKINFDFTWYKSNTKNQTLNVPLSSSSAYKSMYIQTGDVQNMGVEMLLGSNLNFGEVTWNGTFTASYNKNEIKTLMDGQYYGPSGELLDNISKLPQGGVGSAEIILTEGGTLGDLYVKRALARNEDGSIFVNKDGLPVLENVEEKVGSVLPKWNLGFRNDFHYKGISLGFLVSARFGGKVASYTQAIMEGFGAGENSAYHRDMGGVPTGNGGMIDPQKYYQTTANQEGLMSDYIYSANNIRLQELTVGYTFPKAWFNNVAKLHVAFVGRNLWMIHNKAPFDPEATASTGTYYQGLDYFMPPSLRNLGFKVRVEF